MLGKSKWLLQGLRNSKEMFVRHMSKARAVNVRKINPKVPMQEAYSIANSLYDVFKLHGPLSVPNTWIHAKDIGGLNSKTHMKLMLKWMRGRQMLKLLCSGVGSNKKFQHCILPEEPRTESPEPKLQTVKSSTKKGKKHRK